MAYTKLNSNSAFTELELMSKYYFIVAKFLILILNPVWKIFIGFWLQYKYGIKRKTKKRRR